MGLPSKSRVDKDGVTYYKLKLNITKPVAEDLVYLENEYSKREEIPKIRARPMIVMEAIRKLRDHYDETGDIYG